MNAPKYPITVQITGPEDVQVFDNEDELVCTLEDCDTDIPDDIKAWDAAGRPVRIKINMFDVEVIEVIE